MPAQVLNVVVNTPKILPKFVKDNVIKFNIVKEVAIEGRLVEGRVSMSL